jgi:predicted transposase YbfD/YdcC
MNDDRARDRLDNGPQNLAILRRMDLNLAKGVGSKGLKGSMEGKLKKAGWNNNFLT